MDRQKYDVHLYPSVPFRDINSKFSNITIWQSGSSKNDNLKQIVFRNPSYLYGLFERLFGKSLGSKMVNRLPLWRQQSLIRAINMISPDIIHSMETQKSGYLLSKIRSHFKTKWIHSNWGIDLHYFYQFPEHKKKLDKLISQIDVFIAEGERDIAIARSLGFKGKTMIIPSVGGSLDFDLFNSLDSNIMPSERRKIILKGYEGDERLASNVLQALRKLKSKLTEYEVIVYSCSHKLMPIIETIQDKNEFSLKVLKHVEYQELLKIATQSRISITNNLSDGVPNTMLEAMALGSFPIQSNTAITEGWIDNGKNGLLTDPQDVEQIACAISKALQNDELVNSAALFNKDLVRNQLNKEKIVKKIEEIYN